MLNNPLFAQIKLWVLLRLREPSTWGGFAGLLTGLGIVLSPDQSSAIITLGVAIGGVLMVFLPEGEKR